jgi:hypothetical protein
MPQSVTILPACIHPVPNLELKRAVESLLAFFTENSPLLQKLLKMKLSSGKLQFWEWKKPP